MPVGSCFDEPNKRRIVGEYDLVPFAHVRLLEGQSFMGCCGPVTRSYYHFEATPKSGGEVETFIAGYRCAERLLELIGHPKLLRFNPLTELGGDGGGNGRGNGRGGGNRDAEVKDPRKKMCPLNAELYDAIHLLCIAWGKVPGAPMRSTLHYLKKNPEKPTRDFSVIRFNDRFLGRDAQKRTLTEIINELRKKNPTLRQFAFPEMSDVLARNQISSRL
jgi:hypothetical protein